MSQCSRGYSCAIAGQTPPGAMLLVLLAVLLAALLLHHTQVTLRHWERRGVPFVKPLPFLGNFAAVFFGQQHFFAVTGALSERFRETGYCGVFEFTFPLLLVWDPDMAKKILTKEFHKFHDRGMPPDTLSDPLTANLFNLEGVLWRKLRNKLTPTFTSGKLKMMVPLIGDVADELCSVLATEAKAAAGDVDMQVLCTRFAVDVIGTCAFGIQCNSLRTGDDELLQLARETSRPSLIHTLRSILNGIHPDLLRLVPMKLMYSEASDFFLGLMERTVEFRERNGVDRRDFVHLMMRLRESDRAEKPENRLDMTNSLMTAQAIIFFMAGVENVANTVGCCIHYLALDHELQSRAAEEVQQVIGENGGQLSYAAVQKMELLDRIIKEGLRIWPAIGFLMRKCNRTTEVKDLVIEKGQILMISTYDMHNDPRVFPNPTRFDPDRFTEDAKQGRHPYAYLPFGEGPRICIAERFAMLEMKLVLASLVNEFVFLPSVKSARTPVLDPSIFISHPKDGFWVRVEPRVSSTFC